MHDYFGPHLLYDAFGCSKSSLTDLDRVFEFLNDLPGQIQMTKISQPHVFRYSGKVLTDWGITGVVILAESHCSLHTFPERDSFVTLDIYSCNEFDVQRTIDLLNAFFVPEKYQTQVIRRGEGFPGD